MALPANDAMKDNIRYTGTQISYYFICHRKLWLFTNGIRMEHLSDTVMMGRVVHENNYPRAKKEIEIDGKIKIDFATSNGVIHEVKKSPAVEDAHLWQLRFYLYFLKQKGVWPIRGEINYPLLKRTETVLLLPEHEEKLQLIFSDIEALLSRPAPPDITMKRSFCRKCSYFEYCWIDV